MEGQADDVELDPPVEGGVRAPLVWMLVWGVVSLMVASLALCSGLTAGVTMVEQSLCANPPSPMYSPTEGTACPWDEVIAITYGSGPGVRIIGAGADGADSAYQLWDSVGGLCTYVVPASADSFPPDILWGEGRGPSSEEQNSLSRLYQHPGVPIRVVRDPLPEEKEQAKKARAAEFDRLVAAWNAWKIYEVQCGVRRK